MIITLTGENTFAALQAERQLVEAFKSKHGPAGIEKVEGEELEPSRLPDLLQGASLFAPSRLVIIKNISANKSILEPFGEMLSRMNDGITVVIADAHLDKRTKLYKLLKSKSNFQDFAPPNEDALVAWAQKRAKELQAELKRADALYLVQSTGHDQWRLGHEVDKLAQYAPQITRESINLLVEPSPEATAFELLDASFSAKPTQVKELLAILKLQEDPYKLLGLLSSQVYALAVLSAGDTRSTDQIAKDAGLHPFVARKTQAVAKRLSATRVEQIARLVAECDWRLKSTGADPWHILGTTLANIAAN